MLIYSITLVKEKYQHDFLYYNTLDAIINFFINRLPIDHDKILVASGGITDIKKIT